MSNHLSAVVQLVTVEGQSFIAYKANGSVFLEKTRPDGTRSSKNVFEFSPGALMEALFQLHTVPTLHSHLEMVS